MHVYRLVTSGTVEERIQLRAEKKLYLDTMVKSGGADNGGEDAGLETLSKGEMLAMLKFGADRVFKTEEGQVMRERDAIHKNQTLNPEPQL